MDINETITYKRLLEWRIHWIYCDLGSLNDTLIKRLDKFNRIVRPIEDYVKDLQKILGNFQRILWEVSTMMADDTYENEIRSQILDMPAYKRTLEAHAQVITSLWTLWEFEKTSARAALDAEINQSWLQL
jgi:hypothetical protein